LKSSCTFCNDPVPYPRQGQGGPLTKQKLPLVRYDDQPAAVLSNGKAVLPDLLAVCHNEGQQCNRPGPFDGKGNFSLVFRATSRNTPGHDLTALRQEIAKRLGILVLDFQIGI